MWPRKRYRQKMRRKMRRRGRSVTHTIKANDKNNKGLRYEKKGQLKQLKSV